MGCGCCCWVGAWLKTGGGGRAGRPLEVVVVVSVESKIGAKSGCKYKSQNQKISLKQKQDENNE